MGDDSCPGKSAEYSNMQILEVGQGIVGATQIPACPTWM